MQSPFLELNKIRLANKGYIQGCVIRLVKSKILIILKHTDISV